MLEAQGRQALLRKVALQRQLPPPKSCRAIRELSGVSTEDVANALGVTRQTISNWENGKRSPRGLHLEGYLELLDLLRGGGLPDPDGCQPRQKSEGAEEKLPGHLDANAPRVTSHQR
ncbi:helix-turn-helix transcriptional regulator [Streptomyces sp. NPDC047028]|uniref:helix-turn-helix transcriptional regulator n=1 Tax=Streptomyces sp. NPDC047028 TaxID=3155793 RepID=UPI003408EFD6